jgi:hypothetical protein
MGTSTLVKRNLKPIDLSKGLKIGGKVLYVFSSHVNKNRCAIRIEGGSKYVSLPQICEIANAGLPTLDFLKRVNGKEE